ncbi:MAG: hypothetical protein QNJ30_01300 [Kiloniellales bacterium]|nr:hypothetical protein [Kiloniellales bacterium]
MELRISPADCARLVAHLSDDDVAYQPGVDVRGRPVASADLDDAPKLALPNDYRVRIEVDSDDRFGVPARAGSYDADIAVGEALVEADGRVLFNGQTLAPGAAFELGRRCRELLRQTP